MKSKIIVFALVLLLTLTLFALPVFANNPPDAGHSSFSAANQAPADGSSTISVTITLQDSSGNTLSGDSVTFSDPSDIAAVFNPSSTTLNTSGQATFTITSTNAGTDNISVTDTSSNTPLNNLGQVTFTAVVTSTPTPTAQICTDATPGSTPQLTQAVANGTSQITLTWTDATDPVSYYLIAYGNTSGQYIYGNPNVGSQGTTTYTVSNLSADSTYYFVVRAVNGCNSSNFSNEISATTPGGVVNSTPTQSQTSSDDSNQTSVQIVTPTLTPTDTPTDAPTPVQNLTPSALPIPTRTFVAGLSNTKTLEYIFICIAVFGGIGGFIFWNYAKSRRRPTKFIADNQPEKDPSQEMKKFL